MYENKVVAISAQKGGTGKSTTCANLAVGLAKAGKKVCIIDLDSQSNLTMSFGFNPDILNITITDIFNGIMDKTFDYQKEDYMLHAEGIDLVPADITFATIEKTIVGVDSRENILKKFIAKIKDDYDYIQANGKSLFEYDPKCRLAKSYFDFTNEFLRREGKNNG